MGVNLWSTALSTHFSPKHLEISLIYAYVLQSQYWSQFNINRLKWSILTPTWPLTFTKICSQMCLGPVLLQLKFHWKHPLYNKVITFTSTSLNDLYWPLHDLWPSPEVDPTCIMDQCFFNLSFSEITLHTIKLYCKNKRSIKTLTHPLPPTYTHTCIWRISKCTLQAT